jgi:hypothetical protein
MANQSAQWTDVLADQDAPWLDDIDLTVAVTVLSGPDGDETSTWRISGAKLHRASDGTVDVDISIPYKEGQAIAHGTLEPSVAYMQGKLKPSGDMTAILELMKRTSSEGFASWRDALCP